MRTQEWFDTRVARATARILRDAARHTLDVGTLLGAMREITDDPPCGDSVRLLAEALGCLSPDQYRGLLYEVSRFLREEAEGGVDRALRFLDAKLMSESARQPPYDIAAIRSSGPERARNPLVAAILLQGLLWAMMPPSERESDVSY